MTNCQNKNLKETTRKSSREAIIDIKIRFEQLYCANRYTPDMQHLQIIKSVLHITTLLKISTCD